MYSHLGKTNVRKDKYFHLNGLATRAIKSLKTVKLSVFSLLLPVHQPLFGHTLIFGTGPTIVGIRIDRDTTTRSKEASNLNVLWVHQANQVLHNDIDTIFMKGSVTAKAEKVELKALTFHHLHIRNIGDTDFCKVGLSGNGTQAGKLRAVKAHPVVVLRMLVIESFEHLRSIVLPIDGFTAQQGKLVFQFGPKCIIYFSCTYLFLPARYFSSPSRRSLQAGQCPQPSPGMPL